MLSGIAAHYDPSFCGDLAHGVLRNAGVVHVKPNRESRVSDFRKPHCRRPTNDNLRQRGRGGRRVPFQPEDLAGWPLVLSYRSRHKTSLLVSQRRRRKAFSSCHEAGFAENSTPDPAFGSGRSRRTTRAGTCRTAEPRQSADPGGCGGQHNEQGYKTAGCGDTAIGCRFALAGPVGSGFVEQFNFPDQSNPLGQSDAK